MRSVFIFLALALFSLINIAYIVGIFLADLYGIKLIPSILGIILLMGADPLYAVLMLILLAGLCVFLAFSPPVLIFFAKLLFEALKLCAAFFQGLKKIHISLKP